MASESRPRFIYKILPTAAPEPFPSVLPLSELDAKDGFVHLSTAEQVGKPNTSSNTRACSVLTRENC